MEGKTIQVSAQMVRCNPMKDGGMSLGFYTQELNHNEKVLLMEYLNSQGWLLFKENSFKEEDIPDDDAPTDDLKTPSQRLRGVLYRLWEQKCMDGDLKSKDDFETYYRKSMEKIIEQLKTKLQ